MQNNRNTTSTSTTAKRRKGRPPLMSSLVSDRLGAQGFPSATRSAELPISTKATKPPAEQAPGAPTPGKDAWFEQN